MHNYFEDSGLDSVTSTTKGESRRSEERTTPSKRPDRSSATGDEPTRRRRTSEPQSSSEDFTSPTQPCQFKLPQDLIQSLKLHSISSNKTMSEIVFEHLTSDQMISKAWISTRRSA